MVEIDEFLSPRALRCSDLRGGSKRQLFQDLASMAPRSPAWIRRRSWQRLEQREKLGTTGIGEGIAIPHARVRGLPKLTGFFARLAAPVDYDALDDAPVDLVFLLLAPEEAEARPSSRRWPVSPGCCATRRSAPGCAAKPSRPGLRLC